MWLVDHIFCLPNQKATVPNNYDDDFAVATITPFRDAIEATYVSSAPIICQSQYINAVKFTNSTRFLAVHAQ